METKIYTEMDYNEFENLVRENFGVEYNFPADEELMNDIAKTYTLTPADLVASEYDNKRIAEFVATGHGMYMAHTLMEELLRRGVLKLGNYLIKVSW